MSGTPSQPLDPALYESRAGVVIAVVAVTLTVATVAVALRTYARAVMIRQFGADDWAAIVAVVLALGSGIMVASNTLNGHGRHIQVVDQTRLWIYFRTFYISIVLYNGSLTATKLTFLIQYHRILGGTGGQMRLAIIVAFILVALWSISQLLVVIFTCTPIHKFWLSDTPGTCIPNLPFWYINAAGNIVTDVIVFLLPLPALSRLNLRRGQKLGLIGVFCLGFFTCAISVIRIQYLRLSTDVTWDNVASSCWSIGEICSGITCSCLPTLRPLVSRCLPGMGSQTGGSSDRKYRYYYGGGSSSARRGRGDPYAHSRTANGGGTGGGDGGRLRSADENGSSRGIIYPEDIELQSDDRSDKEIRVAVDRVGSQGYQEPEVPTDAGGLRNYGRTMDRLKLGLRPTVRTEVRVGTPGTQASWAAIQGNGIEVKTDFVMTRDQ